MSVSTSTVCAGELRIVAKRFSWIKFPNWQNTWSQYLLEIKDSSTMKQDPENVSAIVKVPSPNGSPPDKISPPNQNFFLRQLLQQPQWRPSSPCPVSAKSSPMPKRLGSSRRFKGFPPIWAASVSNSTTRRPAMLPDLRCRSQWPMRILRTLRRC